MKKKQNIFAGIFLLCIPAVVFAMYFVPAKPFRSVPNEPLQPYMEVSWELTPKQVKTFYGEPQASKYSLQYSSLTYNFENSLISQRIFYFKRKRLYFATCILNTDPAQFYEIIVNDIQNKLDQPKQIDISIYDDANKRTIEPILVDENNVVNTGINGASISLWIYDAKNPQNSGFVMMAQEQD